MALLKNEPKYNTKTQNILARKKLLTTNDLAEFGPIHYTDYRTVKKLEECIPEESAAICGKLTRIEKKSTHDYRKYYIYGKIVQENGTSASIFSFGGMFRLPFYEELIDKKIVVCGKVTYSPAYGYSISNPDLLIEEERFIPRIKRTYTKFSGLSEKRLKDMIEEAVDGAEELLEKEVLERDHLPGYRESLKKIHFPDTPEDIREGKQRILYNELLYLALMMRQDAERASRPAPVFKSVSLANILRTSLPFSLTSDQFQAVQTMLDQTRSGKTLDVLLQGDVGSGKTIVAALMMAAAAEAGFQSVLMAPRSVLAEQHYREISRYAETIGLECVHLRAGMKATERKAALKKIKEGTAKLIVGTHACIGKEVEYHRLGLVVTDEEHLFGVEQKETIREKAIQGIHMISMSATPIPRTIADALYGDTKTIINIKEKPAGRKDIYTWISNDRKNIFSFMEQEIQNGHQCYVVCPAIEENEDSGIVSIETVEKEYRKYFESKGYRIGVVNGKKKKEEIREVMEGFIKNEIRILLSTTVIEVGVNVPNSTVIIIEEANRFGMASLHQMRGRVGRSCEQSFCCLVSDDQSNERLTALTRTNDGFEIAEADLKMRGTGNLIGQEQSGLNRFVDQMIRFPKMFSHIRTTAEYCAEHGYGNKLIARYAEHEQGTEEL